MKAPQVVPHCVILLVGHPGAGHEHEEDDVHDDQHDDETQYLHEGTVTMRMDVLSFLLTR